LPSTFPELGVPADLVATLAQRRITDPFPIQIATLPPALAGRDVCGRAPTGSGKTLAFGIPLVARVPRARPGRPRALVLAPTRELAAQIERELTPLAKARKRTVAAFYGGIGFGDQRAALRRGPDIAVACPGRLADLVQRKELSLSEVEVVVVDEADRMADMGFLPEIRRLLDKVPANRQTLLFSATLDGDVDVLVRRYQRDPVRHEISAPDESKDLRQHLFWRARHDQRVGVTVQVIEQEGSTLVFCRTKRGADRLARQLAQAGLSVTAIHGNRSQPQREQALAAFSAGRVQALVATDVAARGIHVDNIGCVVHFDPPADEKAYVHRSGRTGRAGAGGKVICLVADEHAAGVRLLQRKLGLATGAHAPDLANLAARTTRRIRPGAEPAAGRGRRRRRPRSSGRRVA
jgi:superfamily II DNA/RNA helicase